MLDKKYPQNLYITNLMIQIYVTPLCSRLLFLSSMLSYFLLKQIILKNRFVLGSTVSKIYFFCYAQAKFSYCKMGFT